MGWKFWQREKGSAAQGGGAKIKLSGPKDLSQQIGMYLITNKKMDPDEVWNFKMVTRPKDESPTRFDFRIFDPLKSDAAGVRVANFNTLEDHAELVHFQGWLDKKSQQFEIQNG